MDCITQQVEVKTMKDAQINIDNAEMRASARVDHSSPVQIKDIQTGNLHRANRDELATLYRAVAALNRRGRCVRLLRTGSG